MNLQTFPPPYDEQDWTRSRQNGITLQQTRRKPALPPRPKTAESKAQGPRFVKASAGVEVVALPDLPYIHRKRQPLEEVPNIQSRPRTAGSAESKRQYGIPKMKGQGYAMPSMAGLNLGHSKWRSPSSTITSPPPNITYRPQHPMPQEQLRDQPASLHIPVQRAGIAGTRSMVDLNRNYSQQEGHSQWEAHSQQAHSHQEAQSRPRTAESRPSPPGINGSSSASNGIPQSPIQLQDCRSPVQPSGNMQKAFEDARHWAGGLVARPFESTKHASILRHSHGLVYYQGPGTTLAVSIFADTPLPADTTLWLQNKGFSGKTGIRIKALFGADGSWVNVTPTMNIEDHQVKATDERAWQRDITNFQKKAAASNSKRQYHVLRTTAIVRIPAEAQDGYFQLILCSGGKKKNLCTSPSFRILSLSTEPHSLRGASLATLPLELAAMAAGMYGKVMAGRVVGPVVSVVTSRVQKYMPSTVTQKLASTAFSQVQITEKITSVAGDVQSRSMEARTDSYTIAGGFNGHPELGLNNGPQEPYPVSFLALSVFGQSEHAGLPCMKMTQVSELITRKLHGYYFGWARFVSSEKKAKDTGDWAQALITVLSMDASQLVRASITEANKRFVTVQFTEESEIVTPSSIPTSLEVKVLGLIRADDPSQRSALSTGLKTCDEAAVQAAFAIYTSDVSIAQSYLDHPSWGPECLSQQGRPERPGGLERMKSSFTGAVSMIPLDKMGIRSPVDTMRDQSIVANGFWVVR